MKIKFNDEEIRILLRNYRVKKGRDPSVIRIPLGVYYGHMSHLSDMGGWGGMIPMVMYGVKVVIWNENRIKLEDLNPKITWSS